jgi:hypothetical protein
MGQERPAAPSCDVEIALRLVLGMEGVSVSAEVTVTRRSWGHALGSHECPEI